MPIVSIIIVTYNAADTLANAIESVLAQTYPNIDLVIVDGKSTDGTVGIIQAYNTKIGYWLSEKDNGIYDAMNKGIKAAKGEWIIFLGADDVFINEKVLENVFVDTRNAENVDFVYCDIVLKSTGKVVGGSRDYHQLISHNISHQAIFYRRSLLLEKGGYNTNYKVLADYDMNLRIFRDETVRKKYIPVTVCLFNDKGTSNTTIDKDFFRDQLQFFIVNDKIKANSPLLQKYYFFNGFAAILQHQWLKGAKLLWKALQNGERKLYYFLVTGSYVLSMLGIRKKIKSS